MNKKRSRGGGRDLKCLRFFMGVVGNGVKINLGWSVCLYLGIIF